MAATRPAPGEDLRALLDRIATALDLEAEIVVDEDGDRLIARLIGDDLGLFIGRHGQTIEAVQHLAQRIVGASSGGPTTHRVIVDAAGYRDRREAVLHRQADEAADDALRSDRSVALDAMTSSERRVVHEHLRERGDVDTHSEGAEPNRHLVVSPKSG